MNKFKAMGLALLLSLGLTACNSTDNTLLKDPVTDSFYHEFKGGELKTAGKENYELNGLSLTYPQLSYLSFDSVKGVQLGSSKSPLNNYTIQVNFPEEVSLLSYSLELSVANGAEASLNLSMAEFNKTDIISSNTPKVFEEFDIKDTKSNQLAISLTATTPGAIYLKSLGLEVTRYHNSFDLEVDPINPIPPVNPDIEVPDGLVKPGFNGVPKTNFKPISIQEYYKDTDLTLTRDSLRLELQELISNMKGMSYGDSRYILPYVDESIDNPGKILGIYDGDLFEPNWDQGATWNREHVWACNHMHIQKPGQNYRPKNETINHASDLHNLRACDKSLNSSRSDKYFSDNDGGNYFNPLKNSQYDSRGDVARILFYMYTRYDGLYLKDSFSDPDHTMGKLSILIKWANEDQPDAFEMRRNNRIYEYQGNRNPFIDHPELVNQLFA